MILASESAVAVIGGGPAGLMAAEVISAAGYPVQLFEAMATPGRKFLLAGRSGLNITHDEPFTAFVCRYGAAAERLKPMLANFDSEMIRAWVQGFGIDTFVGGAGRVFPSDRKAAPILRAWRQRLQQQGVVIYTRHRWLGWSDDGALRFNTGQGERCFPSAATLLALGGGSWPRMGSDGRWVDLLRLKGLDVASLEPSNCGFNCEWTAHFSSRFAWQPLKSIQISHPASGREPRHADLMITAQGIEGGAVYALTPALRAEIAEQGSATLYIDLTPERSLQQLEKALATPRGKASMATHLRRKVGIEGIKAGLLRELASIETFQDPATLAAVIKQLPLPLTSPRPLTEAISSAGGVRFSGLDSALMVNAHPGLFVAGEMLDWEAPTGGYLLTGCLATGRAAGQGVIRWLQNA